MSKKQLVAIISLTLLTLSAQARVPAEAEVEGELKFKYEKVEPSVKKDSAREIAAEKKHVPSEKKVESEPSDIKYWNYQAPKY
jgi:hypothetical protein